MLKSEHTEQWTLKWVTLLSSVQCSDTWTSATSGSDTQTILGTEREWWRVNLLACVHPQQELCAPTHLSSTAFAQGGRDRFDMIIRAPPWIWRADAVVVLWLLSQQSRQQQRGPGRPPPRSTAELSSSARGNWVPLARPPLVFRAFTLPAYFFSLAQHFPKRGRTHR